MAQNRPLTHSGSLPAVDVILTCKIRGGVEVNHGNLGCGLGRVRRPRILTAAVEVEEEVRLKLTMQMMEASMRFSDTASTSTPAFTCNTCLLYQQQQQHQMFVRCWNAG